MRRKLGRRALALILAAALALSLTACEEEDERDVYTFGTSGIGRDLRDGGAQRNRESAPQQKGVKTMNDNETSAQLEKAVEAAARHCYCPTCSRGSCPVRDKVQRKPMELGGLDECRRYGGGYQQMEDNFSRLQVLNRYREGLFA